YLVQARTVAADEPGFVFLRSRLTRGAGPAGNVPPDGSAYLARSPGTAHTWDNVVVLDSVVGPHVAGNGWLAQPKPNPAQSRADAGWREYRNRTPDGRPVSFGGYVLNEQEAKRYASRAAVFAGYSGGKGWSPQP
ncbi:MAG TPA: hypothetical protein VIT92_12815, partial [Burkholderiaceae bacterium]